MTRFTKHGHVAYQINQLDETNPGSDTHFFLKVNFLQKIGQRSKTSIVSEFNNVNRVTRTLLAFVPR